MAAVKAEAAEVGVDHGVVVRTHAESTGSKCFALVKGGFAVALQDLDQGAVVFHRGNDDHVVEVLGRTANEGDASNVNFLHDLCLRSAACDSGFEGVEVHDDEVDVGEVVLRHLGLVAFVVPTVENATKHLGMKRLHTAA